MPLTLKQSQTVAALASHLCDFLPGNPHPFANQDISFAGIALDLGLGQYWTSGSKLPAITQLFAATLERKPERFCDLVLETVRRGINYRTNRGPPITRQEMARLNDLVAQVGFKIPELHDPGFLKGLPSAPGEKEKPEIALDDLREHFRQVRALDPVPRGHEFERFLRVLFEAFDMAPGSPFRLTGEQIDGSFQFQGEVYLLEAKWQDQRTGAEDLNAFWGKVAGKAEWSRGLYVSYSGFTQGGLEAFARGKRTNIVCVDGLDLHEMLERNLDFREVLQHKVRRAAETNQAYVPLRELLP